MFRFQRHFAGSSRRGWGLYSQPVPGFPCFHLLQAQVKHWTDGGEQVAAQNQQQGRALHGQAAQQHEQPDDQITAVAQEAVDGGKENVFHGAGLLGLPAGGHDGPVQPAVPVQEPPFGGVGFQGADAPDAFQHPV